MAHVIRPLIQLPRWRRPHSSISHLLLLRSSSPRAASTPPSLAFFSDSCRRAHFRSRALKLRDVKSLSDGSDGGDDSSEGGGGEKKSRNERKREARRAVRWGVELASFSPLQIKRILRVADLEEHVFDALMVVKNLGRDVREGKRRQFNYIGGLLREAEPELMDDLIQAMKTGDQSRFQDSSGADISVADDVKEEEKEESEEEDEEEDSMNSDVVTKWYNALINKDISITNEIYSLRVEFDRQELRQLVRKVQSTLESTSQENGKSDLAARNARKSLTRFLHGLAKKLPD